MQTRKGLDSADRPLTPDAGGAQRVQCRAQVPMELAGLRLDQALAAMFPEYSRARLQQWLREGQATVDGRAGRPRDRVCGGEHIRIDATVEQAGPCRPEAIELDIVYEDDALLVINKPAGLVVHPAAGNRAGTLQNALLHHRPHLAALPRAGIVHRLDKDTSGLMVVAATLSAHKSLVDQLAARTVKREYEAVVNGVLTAGGTVDAPIGRHPVDRKRMAVVDRGKPAVSHYRVVERFRAHAWLRVQLETGRTHQIRVHMAHIGHPLVGDPVYGGRRRLPAAVSQGLREAVRGFRRQALHAACLGLLHPVTGEERHWEVSLPIDMAELITVLRADLEAADSPAGKSDR